ncbi:MAG: hypothetical protein HY613_05330 [Candidatus Rokubacteria bacterium]|nr:hypothetical protein [Candidatus Rokubacteria bacterium]
MPKVTLEFEVLDKGTAVVRQLTGETEKAFARLKAAGAGAAEGTGALVRANERAAVSMRDTKQAIGAVATSFGQVSPQITFAALEMGNFVTRMAGAPAMTKLFAGSAVAAGTAIAYLVSQFRATHEMEERLAAVSAAARGLDLGSLRQGAQAAVIEIQGIGRASQSMVGRLVQAFSTDIPRMFLGMVTQAQEATNRLTAIRQQLPGVLELGERGEVAAFEGGMAGLRIQSRQAMLQRLLATGQAGESTIGLHVAALRRDIDVTVGAYLDQIDAQMRKEFAEAGARGTQDIEAPFIRERAARRIAEAQAKVDLQRQAVDEQARQQAEGVRGRAEQARAAGAQAAIERQQAIVEGLKVEGDAAKALSVQNEAYLKRIGVPSALLIQSDPRARQLIEEEKRARLMAVDETLRKSLWGIDQLKVADEQRARLVGSAMVTAELQRTSAIQQALTKERELEQSIQERLTAALATAGEAITGNLTDKFREAQGQLDALSARLGGQSVESAVAGFPSLGASSIMREFKSGELAAQSRRELENIVSGTRLTVSQSLVDVFTRASLIGDLGTLAEIRRQLTQQTRDVLDVPVLGPPPIFGPTALGPSGDGDGGGYQHGGIVPGPIGAPRAAVVHGGEAVLNPREQAVVRDLVGASTGSGRRPAVIIFQIGSREIARALVPDLQQLIANGELRVVGGTA